jgi:hypothetical protein
MMAPWLRRGSKGKLVKTLQELLNEWGKLPKPIDEDGNFAGGTRDAVKYFQKKARVQEEEEGAVGPKTAQALAKAIGSKADSFAKEFGEPEAEEAAGSQSKFAEHEVKGYLVSIPADAGATCPMVVLFAGNNGKEWLKKQTPANYFKKAILVFGEYNGKFSAFQSGLDKLLEKSKTRIGSISVCGYSAGGQGAFDNYNQATKKVGLIDPTIGSANFKKFDSKTILSIYPNPGAWDFKDPSKKDYTVAQARIDAVELVKKAGGYAETTTTNHYAYPKEFLRCFESKLI